MINKLINLIKKHNVIAIFRHINPDPDALGAQYALVEWIKHNFPEKIVYPVGIIQDQHLSKFFSEMPEPSPEELANALAIVVDTPILERVDFSNLFEQCKTKIVIDHHPQIKTFGDYHFGGIFFCATCEYIGLQLMEAEKMDLKCKLNPKICENLLCGIISDTNRFFYPSTKPLSLRISADLIERGADIQKIYQFLYRTKLEIVRLESYIKSSFQVSADNVAYLIINDDVLQKYNVSFYEAKNLVYTMQNITNINYCALGVYDKNKGFYSVSIRSSKRPINNIAMSFGGGGHALACGVKIKTKERFMELVDSLNHLSKLDFESN